MTSVAIVGSLLWTVAGGVAIGLAVAGARLILAGRTDDHLVEITLTTITAYGSIPSGGTLPHVRRASIAYCRVACRQCRLEAGNISWGPRLCPRLLGIHRVLSKFVRFHSDRRTRSPSGGQPEGSPGIAAAAMVLVLLGRSLAVYSLCAVFVRTTLKIGARYQLILVWGGLRGALALALALALPENVPERQEIVVVCFAVVGFSILVQGLSMPWLIRRLGLLRGDPADDSRVGLR